MEIVKKLFKKTRNTISYIIPTIFRLPGDESENLIATAEKEGKNSFEINEEKNFFVIHVETSGADADSQILEISARKLFCSEGSIFMSATSFHCYFPLRENAPKFTEITKVAPGERKLAEHAIRSKDYADALVLWKEFLEFIGTDSYIVCYNSQVDFTMLNRELHYWKLGTIQASRARCCMRMMKMTHPEYEGCKLTELALKLGIQVDASDYDGAHSDSMILSEVWVSIFQRYRDLMKKNFSLQTDSKKK